MAVACLREAFNFTAANEDHNLYSFDMRKLDKALCVHKDHVSAVMDIDYSPTGKEFVTGSYDRTVRIFGNTAGHSREVPPRHDPPPPAPICLSVSSAFLPMASC